MFSYCPIKPTDFHISGLFLCLLFFWSSAGYTAPASPFLTRNESPFSLIYGIPLTSPARLLEQNKSQWISSLNISNTINVQSGANDQLFIDVETWHLNLIYDYGLHKNWMLRLQIPVVAHSGGFLDSPIETYHQTFGLPKDLRPDFPRDQIAIQYSRDNVSLIDITSDEKSIGDISVQLAWQKQITNDMAISYWGSIKLPTGDDKKLTGSGSTDIALWSAMDYQIKDTRWLYGQAGLLITHNNQVLDLIHRNWAAFLSAGIKFQPWNPIELKAQFEIHSALFDTDIKFMKDVLQLTFGGTYIINEKHKIDIAVAEDIYPGTSPDVNFNLSWYINF